MPLIVPTAEILIVSITASLLRTGSGRVQSSALAENVPINLKNDDTEKG